MNDVNQPINPSETSNLPIQHPINNQKGNFLKILGVIVLLFTVGGGAYYLGNQSIVPAKQNQNTQPVLKQTSPVPIASSTPVLIKLSEAWTLGTKTYSNPKINITFEYPTYFETNETDVQKENKEWAEKYKNDPNVKQPLYRSSFFAVFNSHNPQVTISQEICENKMSVSVQQYNNPQNMSLYNFIADLNKSYPGDGITESFNTYKKSLVQTQLPKVGSYVFEGIVGENPVKEVYFTNQDKVYKFHLIGSCNTGGQYTHDAESVFDNMLKSVKFH